MDSTKENQRNSKEIIKFIEQNCPFCCCVPFFLLQCKYQFNQMSYLLTLNLCQTTTFISYINCHLVISHWRPLNKNDFKLKCIITSTFWTFHVYIVATFVIYIIILSRYFLDKVFLLTKKQLSQKFKVECM